jgi:predicted nuclease of predicted toxin-antitoxin system
MRLLLDQNLSYKLVRQLEPYFPATEHVKLLGMDETDDRLIWQYAKDNGLTIVTQDADFELLAQLRGFPPKVIWLRCGNTSTANICQLLISHYQLIAAFHDDDLIACLELH